MNKLSFVSSLTLYGDPKKLVESILEATPGNCFYLDCTHFARAVCKYINVFRIARWQSDGVPPPRQTSGNKCFACLTSRVPVGLFFH